MPSLGTVHVTVGIDITPFSRGLNDLTKQARNTGYTLRDIFKDALGVSLGIMMSKFVHQVLSGVEAVGDAMIGLNDRLDQSRIAFETMLGSANKAELLLRQLQQIAIETPFEFEDLLVATRRFQAYGFSVKETLDLLRAVSDAAAAFGDTSGEMIQRLTIALGQMRSKGIVAAEEMRQLAEAGIPAWEILSQKMGVSIQEAMEQVKKRSVKARVFIEAFTEYVNERWSGMTDRLMRTFSGAVSVIRDAVKFGLARAFEPAFNAIKRLTISIADFTRSIDFQLKIEKANLALSNLIKSIENVVARFRELRDVGAGTLEALEEVIAELSDPTSELAENSGVLATVVQKLSPLLQNLIQSMRPLISAVKEAAPGFAQLAQALAGISASILAPIVRLLGQLAGWVAKNQTLARALGAALASWLIAGKLIPIFMNLARAILMTDAATRRMVASRMLVATFILAFATWGDEAQKAVVSVARALAKLPSILARPFTMSVRTISSAMNGLNRAVATGLKSTLTIAINYSNAISRALRKISPFARHSPSLVDETEEGVDQIISAWDRIDLINSILDGVSDHLRNLTRTTSELNSPLREVSENLDNIREHFPEHVDDVIALMDAYREASKEAEELKKQIEAEEEALKNLEDALDNARDALEAIRDEASQLREAISETEQAIRDLMRAPLEGEGALLDQIDQLDKAIRRKKLEIAQAELEQMSTSLATTQFLIDLGFQFDGDPLDLMRDELDVLEKQREVLQLQYDIDFGEAREELEKLGESFLDPKPAEQTFEALTQAIIAQGTALQNLRSEYDLTMLEMQEAEGVVRQLEQAVEDQRSKVDTLKEKYNEIVAKLDEIVNALQSISKEAQSMAEDLVESAVSVSASTTGFSFPHEGLQSWKDAHYTIDQLRELLETDIPNATSYTEPALERVKSRVEEINQKIERADSLFSGLKDRVNEFESAQELEELQRVLDNIGEHFPDLPNNFGDLWNEYVSLKDEAEKLNRELSDEVAILEDLEDRLEDAQKAFDDIEEYVRDLEDAIRDTIDQMNELTEAPLKGQSELENQIRDVEKQLRRVNLQIAEARLSGASDETLKALKEEKERLENLRDYLEIKYEIEIEEPRDELKRIAEGFEETGQQGELSFEEAASKIRDLGETLQGLRNKLNEALQIRAERKQELEELQKAYDTQREKVDMLRDAYDRLENKISEIERLFRAVKDAGDQAARGAGGAAEALEGLEDIELPDSFPFIDSMIELADFMSSDEWVTGIEDPLAGLDEEFNKLGEELGKNLQQTFMTAMGIYVASIVGGQLLSTFAPRLIGGLASWFGGVFARLLPSLLPAIQPFLPNIAGGIIGALAGVFIADQMGMSGNLANAFIGFMTIVGTILPTLIMAGPFGMLVAGAIIAAIFAALMVWKYRDKIMEWLGKIKDAIVEHGPKVLAALTPLLGPAALIPLLFKNKDKIIGVFRDFFTEIVPDVFNRVKDAIVNFAKGAGSLALSIGVAIFKWLKGAFNYVIENVPIAIEKIGEILGTIKDLISEKFGIAVDFVKEKLDNIVDAVPEKLGAAKDKAGEILDTIKNFFKDKFEEAKNFVTEKLEAAWIFIKDAFQKIKDTITEKVEGAWSTITEKFGSIASTITEKVGEAWSFINQKFEDIKTIISTKVEEAFNAVKNFFGNMKNEIETKAGDIYNTVKSKFEDVYKKAKEIFENIKSKTEEIWGTIKSVIEGKVGDIYETVRTKAGELKDAFVGKMQELYNGAKQKAEDIYNYLKGKFEDLKNTIVGFGGTIKDEFSGAIGDIPGKIQGLVSNFTSAGSSIINAFVNGLTGVGGTFADIGTRVGNAIYNAAIGTINNIIGVVNSAIQSIVNTANKLPFVNISAPQIPTLPERSAVTSGNYIFGGAFAHGGRMPFAGYALVGEQGPELVRLPRGAEIYSYNKTMKLIENLASRESNVVININIDDVYVRDPREARELGKKLSDSVYTSLRAKGVVI